VTTRVCPSCGAQYVAAVNRCADCDTELVDALSDEVVESVGLGESDPADQMAYELHEWTGDARVVLDGMLNREGIAHIWEIATLVVRAADEDRVDELVEDVESSELPALDPDADQVVYEISGWTDDQRTDLEAALLAEGVPHGIDENGDLVVLEADEERVEPILDRVDMEDVLTAEKVESDGEPATDAAPSSATGEGASEEDGLAAQEAMSALFITSDRLIKDPDGRDDIARLAEATDRAEALPLPYGFSPAVWDDIKAKAGALRDLLAGDHDSDIDVVTDAARVLRQTLRQYV
jgi:hypothetical protein